MSSHTLSSANVDGSPVVLLIARIMLVALFLVSGFGLLMGGPAGFGGFLGSLGLPAPVALAWLVTILKIVASIMVIVGFQTRYAAWALAAFAIAAALIGHNNIADQNEMTQLLKDFAIAGGLILLGLYGPGRLSLDARR